MNVGARDFADLTGALLGQGRSVRFRARGGSMFPLIRHGEIVTARPVGLETLRVGDVVLHRIGPERLVAHRIVRLGHSNGQVAITTRGDASLGPGDRVGAEQILGLVVAVERGGRSAPLDRGVRRLAGGMWVRLWPAGPALVNLLRTTVRVCRKMGLRRGGPQAAPARTLDSPQVGD